MDILFFTILTIFALSLLFLGFFKKQLVLIIFSGIAFLILGIFTINGIEYQVSSTITTINSSTTIVSNSYANWGHNLGSLNLNIVTVLGFLFALFGLFLLIVGAVVALQPQSSVGELFSGDE